MPSTQTSPSPWSRRPAGNVLNIAVLSAVLIVAWLPRSAGPLDLRWDAGVYYVLGTSLAQGNGYRLLNEPGEIRAIQYPPLLPAIIAVHQLALGTDDPSIVGPWLRLSFFAISLGFTVATYMLLRRSLQTHVAFLGTLLCLLNPSVLTLSNGLMAEVPFALASTLFVLCATRQPIPAPWLSGFFAIIGYLLRTAGIALLIAWIVDAVARRDRRAFLFRLAVCAVPVLGWHTYVVLVQASPSYHNPAYPYQRAAYLYHNVSYATNLSLKDPFVPELGTITPGAAVRRYLLNLRELPATLGEAVSAPRAVWRDLLQMGRKLSGLPNIVPEWSTDATLILLGVLVLGCLAVLAAGGQRVITTYLIGYILLVATTPWMGNWPRYWAPITPLLVLAVSQSVQALHGLRHRNGGPPPTRSWPVLVVILAGLLIVNVAGLVALHRAYFERVQYQAIDGRTVMYRLFFYRDDFRVFDAGLDWLIQRAQPADIVVTSMPHWVHLRTRLRAVMPPADPDPNEVLRLLDSVPARYVMAGGSRAVIWGRKHVFPAVRDAPDRWSAVYADPGGALVIYQRRP
jgi:hypothetical protein